MSERERVMTCEQADMLLAQSVFGELEEAGNEARQLRAHLEACPVCREKLADMRLTARLVTEAVAATPAPKLSEPRRAAILKRVARETPRAWVLRIVPRHLALAAMVLVAASVTVAVIVMSLEGPAGREPVAMGPLLDGSRDTSDLPAAPTAVADVQTEAGAREGPVPAEHYFGKVGPAEDIAEMVGQVSDDQAAASPQDFYSATAQLRGGWGVITAKDEALRERAVPELDKLSSKEAAPLAAAAEEFADNGARQSSASASRPSAASPAPVSRRSKLGEAGLKAEAQAATVATAEEAEGEAHGDEDRAGVAISRDVDQTKRQQPVRQSPVALPPARLFRGVAMNPKVTTREAPASTLALDNDTASFHLAQQYLQAGYLPPPGAVRTEAFVNAVAHQTSVFPAASHNIGVEAAAGRDPFADGQTLLRITITAFKPDDGKEWYAPAVIAKDMKLRVEFSPKRVRRYRLIGYEDHLLDDAAPPVDPEHGGAIRDGESVTALYELELAPTTPPGAELVTAYVRYVDEYETGTEREIVHPLPDDVVAERSPSSDPQFYLAAAAARFAELLRGGEPPDQAKLLSVQRVLEQVQAAAPGHPRVAELLEMVRTAQRVPPAP